MKTLSITLAAVTMSVLLLGSLKPIRPSVKVGRELAVEKVHKSLKADIKSYIVAVSR